MMRRAVLLPLLLGACLAPLQAADPVSHSVVVQQSPGRLLLRTSGLPVATYVYRDAEISRPYFAHLRAPGGVPVTRTYPPVEGKDPTDHATFHPGLWLAFGDLSGADSWRLKVPVRHERFVETPKSGDRGQWAVRNRYLAADGEKTLCTETCRYTLLVRPSGYLLLWDSTFRAEGDEATFGDQEEMGLGVRVATPLAVTKSGRISDSEGRQNEAQVRGQAPDWCDYSGVVDGRRVGVTLMPHPANFRRSWFHARDYGLFAANPFGRQALTGGEPSRVVVRPGEALRLRFGVLLHGSPAGEAVDLKAAYADYLRQSAAQ